MTNDNERRDETQAEPPEPREADPIAEVTAQATEAWTRLKKRNLKQTMLIAFVIGVLFHACVVYAVLDDGGAESGGSNTPGVTAPRITPTPTPTLNRQNCDQIRGTDYRSEEERLWFQANCRTG